MKSEFSKHDKLKNLYKSQIIPYCDMVFYLKLKNGQQIQYDGYEILNDRKDWDNLQRFRVATEGSAFDESVIEDSELLNGKNIRKQQSSDII